MQSRKNCQDKCTKMEMGQAQWESRGISLDQLVGYCANENVAWFKMMHKLWELFKQKMNTLQTGCIATISKSVCKTWTYLKKTEFRIKVTLPKVQLICA